MKKIVLALLLISCLVLAFDQTPMSPSNPVEPTPSAIKTHVDSIMALIVPLMMLMIVLAAAVYAVGQMFGAETRARAVIWAKSMLTAVGVAAALIAILLLFLPGFDAPGAQDDQYLEKKVAELFSLSQSALVGLIILLVVIAALVYAMGQMAGAETRARASVWATGLLAGSLVATVIYVIFFEILGRFRVTFFAGMPSGLEVIGRDVIIPVAFFVTTIILITYLISRVFQVPEWEAYLNVELSNLSGSFLILVFVLAFFGVGNLFSIMVVGQASAPDAAMNFLRFTVANSVLTGMYDVFRIQTCTSMLSTFTRRIGEAVFTNVFKVFPGLDVLVSITNVVGYGMVAIYGALSAQITLMNVVDATMIPFFLPAGLILRFFPPTRDAGSFLIAVAFAFQFVFPLTYMVNAEALKFLDVKTYDKQRSETMIQSLCGPFKYGVAGVIFNPALSIPIVSAFPGFTTLMKTVLSEATLNLLPMAEFVPIMQSLSVLSLFALFVPAFALVITMAFINAMTKFLTTKV
jgi:hypothetical protein